MSDRLADKYSAYSYEDLPTDKFISGRVSTQSLAAKQDTDDFNEI